jgi:hypothetical protein
MRAKPSSAKVGIRASKCPQRFEFIRVNSKFVLLKPLHKLIRCGHTYLSTRIWCETPAAETLVIDKDRHSALPRSRDGLQYMCTPISKASGSEILNTAHFFVPTTHERPLCTSDAFDAFYDTDLPAENRELCDLESKVSASSGPVRASLQVLRAIGYFLL